MEAKQFREMSSDELALTLRYTKFGLSQFSISESIKDLALITKGKSITNRCSGQYRVSRTLYKLAKVAPPASAA